MITAAACKELADQYNALSRVAGTTPSRASVLKNIARSFTGLSTQLDRLAALTRDDAKSNQLRLAQDNQHGRRPSPGRLAGKA